MKKLSILFILSLCIGCSKSDDGGGGTPPAPQTPSAAVLTFPANNQECNEGLEVSATQSSVTFTWEASENTDSYEIVLKNLNTSINVTLGASTNQKTITINKGTSYSWYIISKSSGSIVTAQSETWKFYNAGEPTVSHSPFPADLVAPTMGANLNGITSTTLEWSGSDIDNDITGYDVYFDIVSPPTTQLGTTQTELTANASVTAGNTYYWRIVTTDGAGNNSESEVFQFKVD